MSQDEMNQEDMDRDMQRHVHEKLDDFLDRWLDGELSGPELRAFEAHIGECAECADTAEKAEQLKLLAAGLPRELEPPRDLWPDIAARLDAESGLPDRYPTRGQGSWTRAVAAVAVLGLVFFGGMLADRVMQESADKQELASGGKGALQPNDLATAQVTSAQARRELPDRYVRLVSNSTANSQTRDTMLQNLLIVNLAIREVKAALEKDPNDSHLRDMLRSLYAQENQILNRVERMASTHKENVRTGI